MKLYGLFFFICLFNFSFSQTNFNVDKFEYLSPVPGSKYLSPKTNIIIRFGEVFENFNITNTSILNVDGELSGHHDGSLYITKDLKTIVFNPYIQFNYGERVFVKLSNGLKTISNQDVDSLSFYFYISNNESSATNYLAYDENAIGIKKLSKNMLATKDSSLLFPSDFPQIYLQNKKSNNSYFIGINQSTINYLAIIDNNEVPLFYKSTPFRIYDFKIQPSGIITYYDAAKSKFYGMDSLYQVVDSFFCRNGYSTNYHELQVLPNGHSFVIALDPQKIKMDTVKPGTYTYATVIGNVIQEINEDKKVVWQWRTWDHYKVTDADSNVVDFYQKAFEYSHINSIDIVDKDRIIFSVKHFNEITEVNRNSGKIIWRLGGYNNQFKLSGGFTNFKLQHDARLVNGNRLTLFDNQSIEGDQNSRALIFNIDEQTKTANLIESISHNPDLFSRNMGNMQYTSDGNWIIGWGNTGGHSFFMSKVDNNGNTISNDSLVSQNYVYSYRAFTFPWKTKIITSDKDSVIFNTSSNQLGSIDSVSIKNNSKSTIEIKGIYSKKNIFNSMDNFPIQLSSGEQIYLHFKFEGTNELKVNDIVYIFSNKEDEMASLPIVFIGNTITGIDDKNIKSPNQFILSQNYPNPFNPVTTISYYLPFESRIKIEIYNVLGKTIRTLFDENQNSGNHNITWNASGFSSGVYFYKIFAVSLDGEKKFSSVKKMLLLK